MAKSTGRAKIMLASTGKKKNGSGTKYFYTTFKNSRNTTEKMEIMKFDPRAWNTDKEKLGAMVKFKEKKIPK